MSFLRIGRQQLQQVPRLSQYMVLLGFDQWPLLIRPSIKIPSPVIRMPSRIISRAIQILIVTSL